MFQFPASAPDLFRCAGFTCTGCPIRIFTDHFMLADPRDFSQLAASFFASRSLGILRSLLSPFSCESDELRHEHLHDATHLIHLVFFRVLEIFFQKTLELVLPVKLQSAINYIKTIKTRFFDYKLNFLFFTFSYLFISLNIVNELHAVFQNRNFSNGLQRYALFLFCQIFFKNISKNFQLKRFK